MKTTPVGILVELYITPDFRPEISTGEKILPKYWNNKTRRAKPSMTGHLELNQHLDQISADVLAVWRSNKISDAETIRRLMRIAVRGSITVQKKTADENPVIAAAREWLKAYEKANVEASYSKPKAMLERLKEFSEENELSFNSLDKNFPSVFRDFIVSRPVKIDEGQYIWPNPQYPFHRLVDKGDYYLVEKCEDFDIDRDIPVPIMNDTIEKYLTNLITFLYWAEEEYPVNPRFQKWKLIRREAPVIRLKRAELEQLEAAPTLPTITLQVNEKKKPRLKINLEHCRDYIIAECHSLQRISDIKRATPADFHGMNWHLTQKKGNRLHPNSRIIPFEGFTLPAYHVFEKHGFRMPKMNEQYINMGIKEVCKIAGIDTEMYIERWAGNRKIRIAGPKYEFISSHSFRKTGITLMLSMPGVADSTVMALAGITSYKTLKRYKDDPEASEIREQLKSTGVNIVINPFATEPPTIN